MDRKNQFICQEEIIALELLKTEPKLRGSRESLIISPSDVGLHNSIRKEGKLRFIDFEYSGLDDIAKLTIDWVIHPEFSFDKNLESYFIDSIDKQIAYKDKYWKERYASIKKISIMKWCLIILKQGLKTKRSQDLEISAVKARKYYERHTNKS